MKEQTLNTDGSAGKYRISTRLKNKPNDIGNSSVSGEMSSDSSSTLTSARESANQILSMASENAKKAYGFLNRYKYPALGVAGVIGAGYLLWNRGALKKLSLPRMASASKKTAGKKSSKKS